MSKKPSAPVQARATTPTLTVVADVPVPPTEVIAPTHAAAPPFTRIQGMKTMMTSPIDFAAIGKDNLAAITASGKIWAEGVQDLTKHAAATAKASYEESVATFKALTTVKSVKEAIEIQTAFSKAAIEKAIAETNKMTEASLKLTEKAMAPITARISVAVTSMSKAA